MIQEFSLYIRNIIIFLIFTTFANMIIPEAKYKSYINLALGFVMIFLILSPIKAILNNSNSRDLETMIEEFTEKLGGNAVKNIDIKYDETQNDLILSTYEASINEQIKTIISKENKYIYETSNIEIDKSEEGFGNLIAIYLELRESTDKEITDELKKISKPLIKIEPIEIDTNSIFSTKYVSEDKKNEDTEEIKKIKSLYSDFYNLSHDNIYIIVHKKN